MKKYFPLILCLFVSLSLPAQEATKVFSLLNTEIRDTNRLLSYFRNRAAIELPGFSNRDGQMRLWSIVSSYIKVISRHSSMEMILIGNIGRSEITS